MARPFAPNSYVISLNDIVNKIDSQIIDKPEFTDPKQYIDIVIPVWETLPEKIAKYAVWIYNKKIYISQRSSFVPSDNLPAAASLRYISVKSQ